VPVSAGHTTEVVLTSAQDPCALDADVEAPAHLRMRVQRDRGEVKRYPLRGKVLSADKGKPVKGARIFARGTAAEAKTGADGSFAIQLPAGTHELTLIHPSFDTTTHPGVVVGPETAAQVVAIKMAPAAVYLDDYTVLAPKIVGSTVSLLEERRKAQVVSDVIGAEQMSKSGDSDAAAALARVTGVTLVGGRYIYVRGMGQRYSSTVLNLSTLPSPEPDQRVIPLDLFPTALLKDITIQKSYSPEMPADFGGGVVKLGTRTFPATFEADVSASFGVNTRASFQQGLSYEGGPADFLGFGAGHRGLPGPIQDATRDRQLVEKADFPGSQGFSPQELQTFGRMMPNVWTPKPRTLLPNLGLGASIGTSGKIKKTTAGVLAALTFKNDWQRYREGHMVADYTKQDTGIQTKFRYDVDQAVNEVILGGILAYGLKFGEQEQQSIEGLTMVARISNDLARTFEGPGPERDILRSSRLKWVERMLMVQQLRGTHETFFSDRLAFDWRYTFALATRNEPDRRDTLYIYEESREAFRIYDKPENSQRFFSDLEEFNHDVGADVKFNFKQWGGLDAWAKAGVNFVFRDRSVDTRRFKFMKKGGIDLNEPWAEQDSEFIYTPERIGPGLFQFEEITRNSDFYEAHQDIQALYLMGDVPLGLGFRLAAGARFERAYQNVKTFMPFNVTLDPEIADLEDYDVLPGVNFSYAPTEQWVFRLGYGRTLNRPQFRELSRAEYRAFVGGAKVIGNPELEQATIDNVDLRGEWYPEPGQVIALSGFFKYFHQPIEWVRLASADPTRAPANANFAYNFGAELEARKDLDFIWEKLEDVFVAFNAAVIFSQVNINENPPGLPSAVEGLLTSKERPLQGQSPWVFNVQTGYDNADIGTTVTLLYNVYGPRIVGVGTFGVPDTYEQPFHQLDLVYKQKLPWWGLSLTFKAKNLIDHLRRFNIDNQFDVLTLYKGREFSLGVKKKF
jgi:outer membrane receptor protein involved in Fe transport